MADAAKADVDMMTTEYQIVFKTTLPEQYQVEETEVQLSGNSTAKDLTQVLVQLFEDASAVEKKKFNFMVDNTFLSTNLHELL